MKADEEDGLYDFDYLDDLTNDWDATLIDGLDDEDSFEIDVISNINKEPEIETISIEKPIEVLEESIESTKGLTETINESSSSVGGKGPLYQFRTKVDPNDDKNRSGSID